jgi:hypothetical protein
MYKLYKDIASNQDFVKRLSDNACIPFVSDNTDYQAYLAWLEEGGVALSADEPASQPADEV